VTTKVQAQQEQIESLQAQVGELTGFLGAPQPIEMVTVGNPGNPPDQDFGLGPIGDVPYVYRISKNEVTNALYAEFLNSVASPDDPNGLFNPLMESNPRGGIVQSAGTAGGVAYEVKPYMGDKPVVFVDWFDAARFCNWLHNGKPAGAQGITTTERGAYTLTGPISVQLPGTDPIHGANGRNAGARFCLPSLSEWHKAAYYQPAQAGGATNNYWSFPSQRFSIATNALVAPAIASSDSLGRLVFTNGLAAIGGPTNPVLANYGNGVRWNQLVGNLSTVGSGGEATSSYYGVHDMAGNIAEFNEKVLSGGFTNVLTVVRGGSFNTIITNALGARGYQEFNSFTFTNTVGVGLRIVSP
jgi:formylglycine-generating enzyme required for sulfatase activity